MPPHPTYTRELADWICEQLKKDRSLNDICSAPNMPSAGTVRQWVRDDHDGFAARYHAVQHPRGPSSEYTREIGSRICEELSKGRAVKDICQDEGMPSQTTILKWVEENRGGDFGIRYREFRRLGSALAYPPEMMETICDELSKGRTLRDICREPGMPDESTVRLWKRHNRYGFAARFRLAIEDGCESMVDEMKEVVYDDSKDVLPRQKPNGEIEFAPNPANVTRSRLQFEYLRWLVGRRLPKLYGDKIKIEATHEPGKSFADVMRMIDGRSRGLPSQRVALLPEMVPDEDQPHDDPDGHES